VLMAHSAPETARMLRDRGLNVIEVDISEFIRLEGCVTCLSIRIR
jgi:dimethylargininase